MNIKEAVVLAGGLGTRLRSVVNDMPKCMAIVNGKPFIYYVVKNLQDQGVNRFIFSLGYKHEVLEDYLKDFLKNFSVDFIIENEPLGTGGAIKKAYNYIEKNYPHYDVIDTTPQRFTPILKKKKDKEYLGWDFHVSF